MQCRKARMIDTEQARSLRIPKLVTGSLSGVTTEWGGGPYLLWQ